MCRHVAPIGHITKNESLTPHGIALTIASQKRGLIDWTEETINIVYSDPDGGNSRAHCVFDQPLPEAIVAMRVQLVKQNLAPEVVYQVYDQLKEHHSPFGQSAPTATTMQGDISLFVGDEAYYSETEIIQAVQKLLKPLGIQPVLIAQGRSNGYLASSLGFTDLAKEQANKLLTELEFTNARQLLVLSAGDYFCLKQLYEERLGIYLPENIELIEVMTILEKALTEGKLKLQPTTDKTPYAYIDPTHTVRVPERVNNPRKLLNAIMPTEPIELFWRRERAHPVGSTALQFTQPHLAEALTRARLEDARNSGVELLICEDPGTLKQLKLYAQEYDLKILGFYELLADCLMS